MKRAFHNRKLRPFARRLRKEATDEENKLWYEFLRGLDKHFCRQKVIGDYIADFYCASDGLVVELDGSQHFDDEGLRADRERTAYLNSLGIEVVRYTNDDVKWHFHDVCEDILQHLK